MRTPKPTLASLLAITLLTGCYVTHEPGGTSGRDAGVVAVDGSIPLRDAGRPPGRDAGGPIDDCRAEIVEPYRGLDACSDAVSACIRGCEMGGVDDCPGECIASEPECQRCFYQTLIACANGVGCLEPWRDFACCTQSVPLCSALSGADRLQCAGSCPAEIEQYSLCLNEGAGEMCFFEAAVSCNIRFGG